MKARELKALLTVVTALSACLVAQQGPGPKTDSSSSALSAMPSSHALTEAAAGALSVRVREVNVLFSASDWRVVLSRISRCQTSR